MFAEGLLHAKPCSEQRGDLEETAVLWHSQADRPDEGATDAEPGGVISSSFQEDLSFLKHMCGFHLSLQVPRLWCRVWSKLDL